MPELPWEKWYPTNWASEPGLRLCRPSTRGIWFDALNTMMLSGAYQISGTNEELCGLLSCIPGELTMAISQLKSRDVCDILEQNDNITLISRRRKRDCEIKALRSKAGRISATQRQHHPQHTVATQGATPSASTSAYASTDGGAGGNFQPTIDHAKTWLADWKKNGADYSEAETKTAFLALSANGWMWGKNPVTNFQAALERQIQTDRQRNQKTNYGNHTPKPNPRNLGTGIDAAEVGRQAAALVKRKQTEREAAARQPVAAKVVIS